MRWKIHETNPRLQKTLSDALGVSPFFAQLLVNRDIRTPEQAQEFLFDSISSCPDPFLMKDMERAVGRIRKAVERKEKILIYGDYDVDGVTSVALLASIFGELGAEYETFIPDRRKEGYGLDENTVTLAAAGGVKLIVTVDCGINAVGEVECANRHGIDVIVTDHHVVKEAGRPAAYAIVDPHQPECAYPFSHLAGVGVAYKLARALMKGRETDADKYLDFVALGTVADIVPLNGENRVLVKSGLKKIRQTARSGLKALIDVARVDPEKITCRHIGFALGPRINAVGRIGSAGTALELLMCEDTSRALELAKILDTENKNRQNIEKDILKQALGRVEEEMDLEKEKVIVLADEAWHPGVIGIVASRLTEEYNRPAILIALEGGTGKGSGRGVEGFDLFEAIDKAGEHLIDFGGHKRACGISISEEKVGLFRESLNAAAQEYLVREESLIPELEIDMQLPFAHVGVNLINELSMLAPHSPGNREPVFCTGGLKVKTTPRNIGRNGIKFLVTCGGLTCEAITFRKNTIKKPRPGDTINLAYTPSINDWSGIESIQLNIKDLEIV